MKECGNNQKKYGDKLMPKNFRKNYFGNKSQIKYSNTA